MIENYEKQIQKICSILEDSLKTYQDVIPIKYYNPVIIKSGINEFNGNKYYLETASVSGINNITDYENIEYSSRPSRANMQPISSSVWFARMKGSNKKIIITDLDKDLINQYIFSTGFLGLSVQSNDFLTFFTAIIISNSFDVKRDLLATGATQESINNEKFLEIKVPFLTNNQIKEYGKKYSTFVYELSLLRNKINRLKKSKKILLDKYF